MPRPSMALVFGVATSAVVLAVCSCPQAGLAGDLVGEVRLAGQPVSGAKVTLWRTAGKAAPSSLVETSTDDGGTFKIVGQRRPWRNLLPHEQVGAQRCCPAIRAWRESSFLRGGERIKNRRVGLH